MGGSFGNILEPFFALFSVFLNIFFILYFRKNFIMKNDQSQNHKEVLNFKVSFCSFLYDYKVICTFL